MSEAKGKRLAQWLSRYFFFFICYACIGWLYEVFLEVVVYQWGYSDRGVLTGPYCPVYGVGALLFLFTAYLLLKKKTWKQKLCLVPVIFVACALLATSLELWTSYMCEWLTGSWPWQTYARDYAIHFEGRIALSPSIRFGIGGVVFLYIVQPLLEKISDKLGYKLIVVSAMLAAVFLFDIGHWISELLYEKWLFENMTL